ncbi:MAG: hypothetical protein ACYDA2_10750 [Acidimicrobiales bacterium]
MAASVLCVGRLLVHADSTPAACSEELEGRCCPGPDAVHVGSPVSCEAVLGPKGCEICAVELLTERDWRHVVHVARYRRTATRCEAHHRARSRSAGTDELDQRLLAELSAMLSGPAR